MTVGIDQESARIYAFPSKRFKPAGSRQQADSSSGMNTEDVMPSVYESCWYHEEAVREPEQPAKPKFKPRLID
jgi:hypothetical protein